MFLSSRVYPWPRTANCSSSTSARGSQEVMRRRGWPSGRGQRELSAAFSPRNRVQGIALAERRFYPAHQPPHMIQDLYPRLLLFPVLLSPRSLDQADMPSAGDTMRYWNGLLTSFDCRRYRPEPRVGLHRPRPLTERRHPAVTVRVHARISIVLLQQPLPVPRPRCRLRREGAEFGVQRLQVSDVYDAISRRLHGIRNVGFGANITGCPSSIRLPVDYDVPIPQPTGMRTAPSSTWEVDIAHDVPLRAGTVAVQ